MTSSSKTQAFKLVFAHEGGYVNHPDDPGGATNLGVTQAVYDAFRKRNGDSQRSVKSITKVESTTIYDQQYWSKVDGDDLPAGLDYAVYDYAVNSGPGRAVKDLQRELIARGFTLGVDGVMGDQTMNAVCKAMSKDEEGLITSYCDRRLAFMKSLSTWKTFGVGWKRRVMGDQDGVQLSDSGVVDYAIKMAREDIQYGGTGQVKVIATKDLPSAIGAKADEATGKASEGDQAVTKTGVGIAGTVSAVAVTGQEAIPDAINQLQPFQDNEMVAHIIKALLIAAAVMALVALLVVYRNKLKERASA